MTFVLALLVFMAIMAAMAVGVIFGRGPIRGPVVDSEQWALIRTARFVVVTPSGARAIWSRHRYDNMTRIGTVAKRSGIAL